MVSFMSKNKTFGFLKLIVFFILRLVFIKHTYMYVLWQKKL